jgi:hypothetical protein
MAEQAMRHDIKRRLEKLESLVLQQTESKSQEVERIRAELKQSTADSARRLKESQQLG